MLMLTLMSTLRISFSVSGKALEEREAIMLSLNELYFSCRVYSRLSSWIRFRSNC